MPRTEDIAWKFVSRLKGKKWCCPYCRNEYHGTVTRVKSHFRKQPKGGIVSCKKVPEHISALFELLQNQVDNEDDIAWKFVDKLGENKWRCHHCEEEFLGDLAGVKGHLLGVPNEGISICTEVPDHVRTLMQSLLDEVAEEESREVAEGQSREAHGQSSIESNSRDMPSQAEVAEEEIREANRQFSTEPQSRERSIQAEVAEEESRDANSQFFPELEGRLLSAESPSSNAVEQMVQELRTEIKVGVNSDQQSQPQFHHNSTMPLSVQSNHVQPVLVLPQHQNVPHQSKTRNVLQNTTAPSSTALMDMDSCILSSSQAPDNAPPGATEISNFNQQDIIRLNSDQQSQAERQFPQSSTMLSLVRNSHGESSMMALTEERANPLSLLYQRQCSIQSQIQMNDQQTPIGASSFQYDQLPAGGNSNCLQDCNRHSQLQTPTDIDPSIASQHTIDSRVIEAIMVDSQIPDAATNTTGPSSSQDMNRGSPVMDVGSIYANDEEIRNLKRKVENLDDKEADIKEQMEIESAASLVRKKPKILVEKWLKKTERARNNFQIIGQADAETLPPKEWVETLRGEVEELIEQTLPETLLKEARDAKGDAFLERELIGKAIHRNIRLIWDCLKENHMCKLGIHGMGGVGKTTIMMHIHNRLLKDPTFDGVAFITVSQDFSNYKLQSDIWKALYFGIMEDDHESKRAAKLSEQLKRKKNCVLILDDVWEPFELEEVGIPVEADGLKLVLTTRSLDVCHRMECQQMIKIHPLSQQEAESLFLKELGSKVAFNSEIELVVKSIVRECAGLPIGVITMARSMRGVTHEYEWSDSLIKLKESCKGLTDMDKVIMNLKFSYDRLGKLDVQQCFLSCALYPEDESIDRLELVEFFIDQGLIGGLNTRKEQYDRGFTILNQLGNACLLEDRFGILMKMHDLIRDMALHIMSETSIVKAGKQLTRIPLEEDWTNALEKVSLMENTISEFPLDMSPNCPKLSILLLNNCLRSNVAIPDSFFKNLLGLEVLNLSGNSIIELPNSISDLENLRALLLSRCWNLRRIPYLGKLTSLRKLDARGCCALATLEGLERLVNLRYLDLIQTHIKRLPKGTLDCLLNLQCLKVGAINEEDITRWGALETFECYPKNADDFNKCVRVIEQSNNRRCYNLKVDSCFKESKFTVEVSDNAQFFRNLERSVTIREWGHAIVGVGGECTGNFILIPRYVQAMTMTKCDVLTKLSGMGSLEYLERLEIKECENLGVFCRGHDGVMDIHDSPTPTPTPHLFSSLTFLRIEKCSKPKYLFGSGSISSLSHLKQITINKCEEMVGIIAAVTSPPPHPLPFFPRLKLIWVQDCGKMKRALESEWLPHFPNLREIIVWKCEKMEEIIGGPPPYLPVEDISLKSLRVKYCDNMRKLFPHEWVLHLRNLRSIEVEGCKGMVEMISGVRQGQEGSIMTPANNTSSSFQPPISLPKLEWLELLDLPQLKSICEIPISCNSMEDLSVSECPELKGIPLQLQFCEIKELPHIWIEDEEKWKTLKWDHPNAQAILHPYLRKGEHAKYGMPYRREKLCPPNAIELFGNEEDHLQLCS